MVEGKKPVSKIKENKIIIRLVLFLNIYTLYALFQKENYTLDNT